MALACALAAAGAMAQEDEVPILLDAASTDFDRRNQSLVFLSVSITRGDLGISADRADSSALDFADATWVFRGNVRIRGENGRVDANRATMVFRDHRIVSAAILGSPALLRHADEASVVVRAAEADIAFEEERLKNATLTGKPATFEHDVGVPEDLTRGQAGRLEYDFASGRVLLAEDAVISQGGNEIRGRQIAYDIEAQRVVAGTEDGSERVRVTIIPSRENNGAEDGGGEPPDEDGT